MRSYLRSHLVALTFAATLAAPLAAGPVLAADNQAGVPLAPSDAAGPWTLQVQGHSVCVLSLGRSRSATGAYAARVSGDCGDVLPPGIAGWSPAASGMNLVTADGEPVIEFDRWSNSLFVSKRDGGGDLQLRRGAEGEP